MTTVGGGSSPYQTGWTELNNGLAITQFYGGAGHPATGRITAAPRTTARFLQPGAGATPTENWTRPFGGDGGFSAYDSADPNYFYGEYVYAQSTGTPAAARRLRLHLSGPHRRLQLDERRVHRRVRARSQQQQSPAGGRRSGCGAATTSRRRRPSWEVIKNSLGLERQDHRNRRRSGQFRTSSTPATTRPPVQDHERRRQPPRPSQGSWTTIDDNGGANPLPNRRITRITIDPTNTDIVYVTFGGFSGDNVYKSVNGGATWTDITGPTGGATALPDVPVRDLEIHPTNSNWIYAGTEVGIFTSENGGATWSLPHDGPSNVSVDELFFMNTTLFAATHGRGMFSTPTSGPFTDSTLSGVPVKAIHVAELRSYINGLRKARGLDEFSFTDPVLSPQLTLIRAIHVAEMRAALDAVYTAARRAAPSYTDDPLTIGTTPIRAVHLEELRAYALSAP